jgi:hypothetical protein
MAKIGPREPCAFAAPILAFLGGDTLAEPNYARALWRCSIVATADF